ncbi:MAG: DUF1365 domain-containing protein [Alphaproteobacteria bacterium]|nr:DUF1365 domain-containing protein [Alphaproteobacteria bacterium]
MHARLFPRKNAFRYGIYYVALPLSRLADLPLRTKGFVSFSARDHGACDGTDLQAWVRSILARYGLAAADGEIVLVCMPRVMGYVFNPVSFWLCYDHAGDLRAVLCEVHNTFGERHTYVCARDDRGVLIGDDVVRGEKVFHVSPFLQREGEYSFRFEIDSARFAVWIDYFDGAGQRQLLTALAGQVAPLTAAGLRGLSWRYPLVTMRAVFLIHWQALKLVAKGIKYVPRPLQRQEKTTGTGNLTKN